MNYAGLIYDDSSHYVDHLAPLCSLMNWPLIVCEERIAILSEGYYPDLKVIQKNLFDLKLPAITLTCGHRLLLEAFFPGQRTKTVWLPHGNSDKGWNSPFFEALQEEEIALVYGQKMIDFMHQKKAFPKTISVGNFRLHYYMKHKKFYEKLFNGPKKTKIFLYTPTWDDAENNNSFWKAFPSLSTNLPKDCHLLIKLHPNTLSKYVLELEILMGRFKKQKNITFLPEFPPIYPLLNACDAYIGDMSSIGYDFLHFNRPLFFLNANPSLALNQCGLKIEADTFDFTIQKPNTFDDIRKSMYEYTFDPCPNWNELSYALRCL
jgi:hypothetical protein